MTPRLCFYLTLLLMCFTAFAEKRVFNIYHDSDYSNHKVSANAMRMGFMTALAQQITQFGDVEFNFIEKDHRGNSNRSLLHMKQFLEDPDALFILGGLHSPPYIKYKSFIARNEILLLVPWAAGGPITRHAEPKNWVFRLSIDDMKAGYRIVQFAQQAGCKNPQLLLERTPWGKSNELTMKSALGTVSAKQVSWFSWNTKFNQAKIILRDIATLGADCVLFVGNAVEGKNFVQAMSVLPPSQQLPMVSHWGITGGDFFSQTKAYLANNLTLNFIQTCFSFRNTPLDPYAQQVVTEAQRLFPETFKDPALLQAPAGFVHSYDLTRLALHALRQVDTKQTISAVRDELRRQLEQLDSPIDGLVKTYQAPFSPWQPNKPDAHEALSLENFCMADYSPDGGINIIPN